MENSFAHTLPALSSLGDRHYLHLYQNRKNLTRQDLESIQSPLLEFAVNTGRPADENLSESIIVSKHIELISKELYSFVARPPTIGDPPELPWTPTSSFIILKRSVAAGSTTSPLLQPSKTFNGTQLPCYRVNDELMRVVEQPIRKFQKPETWEYRQATMREFLTPARMALAHQAVEAVKKSYVQPATGGSSTKLAVVSGFHQLAEDKRSFVHFGDGLLLHVWRSGSEARRLVSCAQKLWQTIFEHSLHPYGTLTTAIMYVKGLAVTFTLLPPLLPLDKPLRTDSDPSLCAATATTKTLAALVGSSTLSRGLQQSSFAQIPDPHLMLGADGRYYFMQPTAFGISLEDLDENPPVNRGTPLRVEWYYHLLPNGTSSSYTRGELIHRVRSGPVEAVTEAILKGATLKVPEMVTQQIVTNSMHSLSVNIRLLYIVLEQLRGMLNGSPKYSAEIIQAAMEAVHAEMICRSVKALIRAELCAASLTDGPDAGVTEAPPGAPLDVTVERVNRFMKELMKGEASLWEEQVMVVLREKFNAPPDFSIPFHSKYFKIVMWYVTPKIGAAYDAKNNRFSRVTQAGNPNSSFFFVPETVKMHSAKQTDEAMKIIALWWSSAERLPSSTPMALMEKTLRMQRIASITVIMRHTSRVRFLDDCFALIGKGAASGGYFALHQAMVCTFQMMMIDALEPSRVVDHVMFKGVLSGLNPLLPSSVNGDTAWLNKDLHRQWKGFRSTNCHFCGWALRSIGSVAMAGDFSKSAADVDGAATLRDLVISAAALQLRWNATMLDARGQCGDGGCAEALATLDDDGASSAWPVDLHCNAQLLDDVSSLKHPIGLCCELACLASHVAQPRVPFAELPPPALSFRSMLTERIKSIWDESERWKSFGDTALNAVRGCAWMALSAAGGPCKDSPTASLHVDDVRYNDPDIVTAIVRLAACLLFAPAQQQANSKSLAPLFDIQQILGGVYPTPSDMHFSVSACNDVNTAIGTNGFANTIASLITQEFIPGHKWFLVSLLTALMRNNTAVNSGNAKCVAAIEAVEAKAKNANIIKAQFARLKQGGAAAAYEVGSSAWFKELSLKMNRLFRQSELFALGMEIFAGHTWTKAEQSELREREQCIRWSTELQCEVEFNRILQDASSGAAAHSLRNVIAAESTARHYEERSMFESLCLSLKDGIGEVFGNELDAIVRRANYAASLSALASDEACGRHEIERQQFSTLCIDVVWGWHSEVMMNEITAMHCDASRGAQLQVLQRNEADDRIRLCCDELCASAEELLPLWGSIEGVVTLQENLSEFAASGGILSTISEEESMRRVITHSLMTASAAQGLLEYHSLMSHVLWEDWASGWGKSNEHMTLIEFVEALYTLLYMEHSSDIALLHHGLRFAQHAAAMDQLDRDEEDGRGARELEWRHGVALQLATLESNLRSEISSAEARAFGRDITHPFRFGNAIDFPEDQGRQAIMHAEAGSRALVVGPFAMRLNHCIGIQELFEAEGLLRFIHTQLFQFRRAQLISRPFILSPESMVSTYSNEHNHRIVLAQQEALEYKSSVIVRQHRREVRSITESFVYQYKELFATMEENQRCVIVAAYSSGMFDSQVKATQSSEVKSRAMIVASYVSEFVSVMQKAHESFHRAMFLEAQRSFLPMALSEKERLHRYLIEGAGLRTFYVQRVLPQLEAGHRQQIYSEYALSWEQLNRLCGLSERLEKRRAVVQATEALEWKKIIELQRLMKSIAENTFHATPKELLRPSDRILGQLKRRKERLDKERAASPVRHPSPQGQGGSPKRDALNQEQAQLLDVRESARRVIIEEESQRVLQHYLFQLRSPVDSTLEMWFQSQEETSTFLTAADEASVLGSPYSASKGLSAQGALGAVRALRLDPNAASPIKKKLSAADAARKRLRALQGQELTEREALAAQEKMLFPLIRRDLADTLPLYREARYFGQELLLSMIPLASLQFSATLAELPPSAIANAEPLVAFAKDARNRMLRIISQRVAILKEESYSFQLLLTNEGEARKGRSSSPRKASCGSPTLSLTSPSKGKKRHKESERGIEATSVGLSPSPLSEAAKRLSLTELSSNRSMSSLGLPSVLLPRLEHTPTIRSETDISIGEWDTKATRMRAMARRLDELWPTEKRLRMQLDELEQRCRFELASKYSFERGAGCAKIMEGGASFPVAHLPAHKSRTSASSLPSISDEKLSNSST